MKIYADPITVNCRKVLAGMAFLDAPFERVHVDYFKGEHKEAPYLAVNPQRVRAIDGRWRLHSVGIQRDPAVRG